MKYQTMFVPERYGRLAILLMACATSVFADPALQLELSADKTEFILGEPVVIQVTLHNTGSQAVDVVSVFDPTYGTVRYSITAAGGATKEFEPAWLDEYQKLPTIKLEPGQRTTGDARLFLGANNVSFAAAGSYKINARFGKLQAAALNIKIAEPSTTAEREAAALMTHKDVAMFIFAGGGETLVQAQTNLQKVIATAPGSLLSGYASYALGTYYAADARDFKRNALRRADLIKAEALFLDALKQPLTAPFRIKAYSQAISAAVLNKHPEVADKYLSEFRQAFSNDPRAMPLLKSLETTLPTRR